MRAFSNSRGNAEAILSKPLFEANRLIDTETCACAASSVQIFWCSLFGMFVNATVFSTLNPPLLDLTLRYASKESASNNLLQ